MLIDVKPELIFPRPLDHGDIHWVPHTIFEIVRDPLAHCSRVRVLSEGVLEVPGVEAVTESPVRHQWVELKALSPFQNIRPGTKKNILSLDLLLTLKNKT